MGLFGRKKEPSLATVHGRPLRCVVCGAREFWDREVKLNTTGAELFDLAWANQSAMGLVCATCGYLHEFVGDAVQLWELGSGYPNSAGDPERWLGASGSAEPAP